MNPNDLNNLVRLPVGIHQAVNRYWEAFGLVNKTPTHTQILNQRAFVDEFIAAELKKLDLPE